MTETMDKSEGPDSASPDPSGASVPPAGIGPARKLGPMGYGGGPLIAAGVMVGGAVLFAGWGITQMASAEGGIISALQEKPVVSAPEVPGDQSGTATPNEDGTVTVTLPDLDGNGIPDAFEDKNKLPGTVEDEDTGRGDEDKPAESEDSDDSDTPVEEPEPEPKAEVYIIEPGDTLSEISGETGVPIDLLVEANGIQNPNLIFAGASLLIPPT